MGELKLSVRVRVMADSGPSRMENGEMTENDSSRAENEEEMAEDDRWGVGFRRRLRQQQREIINDVQSKWRMATC